MKGSWEVQESLKQEVFSPSAINDWQLSSSTKLAHHGSAFLAILMKLGFGKLKLMAGVVMVHDVMDKLEDFCA